MNSTCDRSWALCTPARTVVAEEMGLAAIYSC
jgi:hypothetical protein